MLRTSLSTLRIGNLPKHGRLTLRTDSKVSAGPWSIFRRPHSQVNFGNSAPPPHGSYQQQMPMQQFMPQPASARGSFPPNTHLPFTWMFVSLFTIMHLVEAMQVDNDEVKELVRTASFGGKPGEEAIRSLMKIASIRGGWAGFPEHIPVMVKEGLLDTLFRNIRDVDRMDSEISLELVAQLMQSKSEVVKLIAKDKRKLNQIATLYETSSTTQYNSIHQELHSILVWLLESKHHLDDSGQRMLQRRIAKRTKELLEFTLEKMPLNEQFPYAVDSFELVHTLVQDPETALDLANTIAALNQQVFSRGADATSDKLTFDIFGMQGVYVPVIGPDDNMLLEDVGITVLRTVESALPKGRKLSQVAHPDGHLLVKESELPSELRGLQRSTWRWLMEVAAEHAGMQRRWWDVTALIPKSVQNVGDSIDTMSFVGVLGFLWGKLRTLHALRKTHYPPAEYFRMVEPPPSQSFQGGAYPSAQAAAFQQAPQPNGYMAPHGAAFQQAPQPNGYMPPHGAALQQAPQPNGYMPPQAAAFQQAPPNGYAAAQGAAFQQPNGQMGPAGSQAPRTAGGWHASQPFQQPHAPAGNWKRTLSNRYGYRAFLGSSLLVAWSFTEDWLSSNIWVEDERMSKLTGLLGTLFNSSVWLAVLKAMPYSFAMPYLFLASGTTKGLRLVNIEIDYGSDDEDGGESDGSSDSNSRKGGSSGRWV